MNESRTRAVGETVVEGRLLAVNVGAVRQIELAGQARTTAIWKLPVSDRVAVRGVNLVGDDQADRHAPWRAGQGGLRLRAGGLRLVGAAA